MIPPDADEGCSGVDPWSPTSAELTAFTTRPYRCHHCGATGLEARDTDQVPGPVRFLLGTDTLLLPFCPACGLGRDGRWRAAMRLAQEVEVGTVAWVDPTPLPSYRCSRPGCDRLWSHLGGPKPYPVLDDPHATPWRRWHPCPWCLADDLDDTVAAHRRRSGVIDDLDRWTRELGGDTG